MKNRDIAQMGEEIRLKNELDAQIQERLCQVTSMTEALDHFDAFVEWHQESYEYQRLWKKMRNEMAFQLDEVQDDCRRLQKKKMQGYYDYCRRIKEEWR